MPLRVAVIRTVVVAETAAALIAKDLDALPVGMVTDAGRVTNELLSVNETVTPGDGAV
jgi:hypothetical protein